MLKNKVQWKSLTHKGPAFPEKYKRLPKTVTILCNGRGIHKLSDKAEEAACMFAEILISKHRDAKNRTFQRNFFEDFRALLNTSQRSRVTEFRDLDFSIIERHLKKSKKDKKKKGSGDKGLLKRKAERLRLKHGVCKVDGRSEPLANWMVEPPGIFRGRGGHPDHGRIKLRINPRDVIINCGQRCHVKAPGRSGWKEVIHEPTVAWLAKYRNNLGQTKYIQLNQSSKLKTQEDKAKFDLARKLGKKIRKIRYAYKKAYDSHDEMQQQRAVALFLIDKFSLRAGNEKGLDAADTVGCCTLRKEHVALVRRGVIRFDFKGKDAIAYQREVRVPEKVSKLIKTFMAGKFKHEKLFDELNANDLNAYLKKLMPGLTCKVFRTYNSSLLFQKSLLKHSRGNCNSQNQLITIHNKANLEVAKLCNHKKAVSRQYNQALDRLDDKIENAQIRYRSLSVDTRFGPNGFRLKDQLENLKAKKSFKLVEKDFSLGTSKSNYIDPRISVAWCQKKGLTVENVFSKTLRSKYKWAIKDTSKSFKF